MLLDVETMLENQVFLNDQAVQNYVHRLKCIPINTSRVCTDCEEDIDPRRLEVLPTATQCTTCAAEIETKRNFEKMLRNTRGVIQNISL